MPPSYDAGGCGPSLYYAKLSKYRLDNLFCFPAGALQRASVRDGMPERRQNSSWPLAHRHCPRQELENGPARREYPGPPVRAFAVLSDENPTDRQRLRSDDTPESLDW